MVPQKQITLFLLCNTHCLRVVCREDLTFASLLVLLSLYIVATTDSQKLTELKGSIIVQPHNLLVFDNTTTRVRLNESLIRILLYTKGSNTTPQSNTVCVTLILDINLSRFSLKHDVPLSTEGYIVLLNIAGTEPLTPIFVLRTPLLARCFVPKHGTS